MQPENNQNPEQPNTLPTEPQPLNAPVPPAELQPVMPSLPTNVPPVPQTTATEYVAPEPVAPAPLLIQTQSVPLVFAADPISQNTLESKKPKRRMPRWLVILLSVIIVLTTLITIIVIMYLSTFKTVTYQENSGKTFTMKFYKDATLKSAADMPPFGQDVQYNGSDFLIAPSGKYPLAIQIKKNNGDSLYTIDALCADPAFTLNNVGDNQSDVVCHLYPDADPEYIYFYEYKDGDDKYVVTIVQYVEAFNNPTTDPEQIQEKLDELYNDSELNLKNFNEDLQIILPSIKIDK